MLPIVNAGAGDGLGNMATRSVDQMREVARINMQKNLHF